MENNETSNNSIITEKLVAPSVDFSYQFNLAREKIEKKIFAILCKISKKLHEDNRKAGILIVLGFFDNTKNNAVVGMRNMAGNKIEKYIDVVSDVYKDDIYKMFSSGEDGAIVININGQIIGQGIYLTVEQPSLEIPKGTGTRHISAASFSTREEVLACFTLSEENFTVRVWRDGSFVEQFHPEEKFEE